MRTSRFRPLVPARSKGEEVRSVFWDIQNEHVSHVLTANPDGKTDDSD
jgi:hypothetical protein